MRAYLLVALLLLLIFGSISGYLYQRIASLSAMDFTPPPLTVSEAVATQDRWDSTLEAVGTIKAARGVELSTEESGEITAITVRSGNRVEAGDLLLTLNDKVEKASRERQIANLELAELLFERDAKLVKQKSIPQTQYDRSKADLDSAVAQLAETEARLENKRLRAPFAGTVGIFLVKEGDYVEPGTAITSLQDLTELELDFSVPARHFPRLRQGQKLAVRVDAFPDRSFSATLQAIDAHVDSGTRNLLLRATLEESDGLLPGMFAQLTLDLDQQSDVVTLPETAVTYSIQGNTVYVIRESETGLTVQPRVVRTGGVRKGRIAISEGLQAGERVVAAGQNKLYRDAAVVIGDTPAQ